MKYCRSYLIWLNTQRFCIMRQYAKDMFINLDDLMHEANFYHLKDKETHLFCVMVDVFRYRQRQSTYLKGWSIVEDFFYYMRDFYFEYLV